MKAYPTQEDIKKLLSYDSSTGKLTWIGLTGAKKFRNGNEAGSPDPNGYVLVKIRGSLYLAHRLIWIYVNGSIPVGDENSIIDHINHNTSDNRLENLRMVTRQHNGSNCRMRKNNTSGFKGVIQRNGRWGASITYNYYKLYIGYFGTKYEAADAYNAKAAELFGEYAYTGSLSTTK